MISQLARSQPNIVLPKRCQRYEEERGRKCPTLQLGRDRVLGTPVAAAADSDGGREPYHSSLREDKMNMDSVSTLVERLRKDAIGRPVWLPETQVYEYQDRSAKTVAVLKLIRAAHGVSALDTLCRSGLFIDFGVIIRCVYDCTEEVYFLLENYPENSENVNQFVKAFFENTIDGERETNVVSVKKIRSAMVRVLTGKAQDERIRKIAENIHKIFSGYVHANYAQIMEVYNGRTDDFNLSGVPSPLEQQKRTLHVEQAAYSVLNAAAFAAAVLGLQNLCHDIVQSWRS